MKYSRLLIVLTCAALQFLSGCAGGLSEPFLWQDNEVSLVWPPPPDTPRLSYLRQISGPSDFKDDDAKEGFLTWMLGGVDEELPLLTPFAVAVDLSEVIWVADNGARMLYQFDVEEKEIKYYQSFNEITLNIPSGVVVDDSAQRVFLSDAGNALVFVLDVNGNYLDAWAPSEGFKRPAGLAIGNDGALYVADAKAGVVYVFNRDGKVINRISSKLNPGGLFRRPINVALGPNGEIAVLDAMSFRVEILSQQGELLSSIGRVGDSAGSLARPKGLAIDSKGHVFVSDAAFDNIQVFDLAGNLLMYFGSAGSAAGQFNLPAGLFIDHKDRLFAADSYNHRVQIFSLLD